jgi:exodeoxyribonuclease VII small subunit
MSTAAAGPECSFEEALSRLESIVEAIETGDLPLEQLLSRYEEGTRLVKLCQERLAAAEIRIQQLDPRAAVEPGSGTGPGGSGGPGGPGDVECAEPGLPAGAGTSEDLLQKP